MHRPHYGPKPGGPVRKPVERCTSKTNSALLMHTITKAREQMKKAGVKYEPEYYTTPLDPEDRTLMKLYLTNIGAPGIPSASRPARSVAPKVLTARVGGSCKSTIERVHRHNQLGAHHCDPRTKHGAGRWVLCMVLYIPQTLRRYCSSKVLKHYWSTTHGGGKLRCGIMLHKYLGLHCTVMSVALPAVRQQMPKVVLPDTDVYDFRPEGVENVNQSLTVSNKIV
jgi:hypothetical protein